MLVTSGCRRLVFALVVCCLLALHGQLFQLAKMQAQSNSNKSHFFEGPGVLPSQIFKARGFLVQDHHITTKDGYRLRLTRALNPLINKGKRGLNKRIPILFTHGILESFNVFVANSFGVKPKNLANSNLAKISLELSRLRLADEPSAKSLPMLALNHGHEVWLMSRRGFPGSQTQVGNPVRGVSGDVGTKAVNGPLSAFAAGLTDYGRINEQIKFSINKQFWNFSLDQQAEFDVPQAIDYVLAKTKHKQVSVVGHSAGGTLTLAALSLYPDLSKKINSAIIWSGPLSLGHGDIFNGLLSTKPLLENFIGAVPPTFTTDQFQGVVGLICSLKVAQLTICESVSDLILGKSGGMAPLRPEFINSLLYSSSSHELAQILQITAKKDTIYHYDYGRQGNMVKYGQIDAPAYNFTRLTLDQMSFYVGETDFIVSVADIEATRKQIPVRHRYHLIGNSFNHQGYFFHRDTARLAIIPSLREIQQFSERTNSEGDSL